MRSIEPDYAKRGLSFSQIKKIEDEERDLYFYSDDYYRELYYYYYDYDREENYITIS